MFAHAMEKIRREQKVRRERRDTAGQRTKASLLSCSAALRSSSSWDTSSSKPDDDGGLSHSNVRHSSREAMNDDTMNTAAQML